MVLPDDFAHLSAAGVEDVIKPLVEQGRGLRHPASYYLKSQILELIFEILLLLVFLQLSFQLTLFQEKYPKLF